jgi:hypothetical protein
VGKAFRVLILGDPTFRDYGRLRDALDAALVNRLPDVVIVTSGGPGLPALAASYARSRGLELLPVIPDRVRYPGCAEEKRDERLVELADAIVVVGEVPDEPTRQLLARLRAKGLPVLVAGPMRVAPAKPRSEEAETPRHTQLPD